MSGFDLIHTYSSNTLAQGILKSFFAFTTFLMPLPRSEPVAPNHPQFLGKHSMHSPNSLTMYVCTYVCMYMHVFHYFIIYLFYYLSIYSLGLLVYLCIPLFSYLLNYEFNIFFLTVTQYVGTRNIFRKKKTRRSLGSISD